MKTFLPALLFTLLLGCKKESDDAIKIGGYLLRDQYGQPMGSEGAVADDWQLGAWSSFSPREQDFLAFADTVRLDNTLATSVQPVVAYPNPVTTRSNLQFWSADSVKVKVALVDAQGRVLRSYAGRFKGSHHLAVDVSDRLLFPTGRGYRYYYSFSAAGHPNFKAGYGDVKVN